tara:strand:- start:1065 stop:1334 length:270 start_codon:yes stop_codon:yes gene_type:complete
MFGDTPKIKDVKVAFGKLVKTFRKNKNLTQQELADELSLSRITIQNLESGKNFTIDTLLKTLQHFDQLPDLMDYLNKKSQEQDDINSLY